MGATRVTGDRKKRQNRRRRLAVLVGLLGLAALLTVAYRWAAGQDPAAPAAPPITSATVTAPPPVSEPSSLRMERQDTAVRLVGKVKTASEREALLAGVADSGFEVDDAIVVSDDVTDSDTRPLAVLLPTLLDGTEDGELSLSEGTVTVTGEALDPVEAEEIRAAIDDVTAAGLVVDDQTTTRVLPESVQIAALQEEIDQIFELARTIEGQYPNFAISVDELSEGATTTLDRVAVAMRRYPLPAADVIGHADATGSEATNLVLSEDRAQAVLDYLVGVGVEPVRLDAIGRGESEPRAGNDTEAGRAENRRVDFFVKSRSS